MKSRQEMLEEARRDFASGMNWMDFNNKYFRQGSPYIPKSYKARQEFVASPEYKEVQDMKYKLMEQQPDVNRPQKTYSGEFRVRVGEEIHRQLAEEAEEYEFKSMNDLCIAKLGIPYGIIKSKVNRK